MKICKNCGTSSRIHKESKFCWKCGSGNIETVSTTREVFVVAAESATALRDRKKELLEKQLELLSKQSEDSFPGNGNISEMSHAMVEIITLLGTLGKSRLTLFSEPRKDDKNT